MCVNHVVHRPQEQRLAEKSGENAFAACTRAVNQMHGHSLATCLLHPLWSAGKTNMWDDLPPT